MAGEWTTVGQLDSGTVFVTRDGVRAVKSSRRYTPSDWGVPGPCQCVLLDSGEYAHFSKRDDEPALPIPVPTISPNLDGTLAALLLAALAGDADALAPLRDWLAERLGDADTLEAVRREEREKADHLRELLTECQRYLSLGNMYDLASREGLFRRIKTAIRSGT